MTSKQQNDDRDHIRGRVPPQAVDIERNVLGAMLIDKEAVPKVLEMLDIQSFYNPTHQKIFKAMSSLFERNEPIDAVTVLQELRRQGTVNESEDPVTITELTMNVSSSANAEYHARIVAEKGILRKFISKGSELVSRAYSDQEDALELMDEAEDVIFRISEAATRKTFRKLTKGLHSTFDTLERLQATQGREIIGVPSGFKKIDELTSGFQDSELIIIAGRPSQGKTAIALSIARNAALHAKHPISVGVFSLEMSEQALVMRLLASEARVNGHGIRSGKMSREDWAAVSRASGNLSKAPIHIDDSSNLTVFEMRAKARRLKSEYGIGMIIVDYLQLMSSPPAAKESREREISHISRSLKSLAKDLSIPVIALSQLNRAIESRTDRQPMLADLRESGAIEQDADVVMFVHRPETYKQWTYKDDDGNEVSSVGMAEIIIGKQRNGPTGVARLSFRKEWSGFEELAPPNNYLPEQSDNRYEPAHKDDLPF